MSRIGVKPVMIPDKTTITVGKSTVKVQGPKGTLEFPVSPRITVAADGKIVRVNRLGQTRSDRALHGLTRAMIANMITGVNQGYVRELEIVGVGYRAQLAGKKLTFQVGYSHPIDMMVPAGISVEVPKPTQLIVSGIDKQKVGQLAASIRRLQPPEPYKGKGIRYVGERIRQKAGKAVGKKK